MNRTWLFTSMLLMFASHLMADIEETENIEKTFRFQNPNTENWLIVDNVFGDIEVTGYDGRSIEMVARKSIEARTEKKVREAEEEV